MSQPAPYGGSSYPMQPQQQPGQPQHYPPQQQVYYSPQVPQQQVVFTTQPVQTTVMVTGFSGRFGESPVRMTCPNCHQSIQTETHYQIGLLVWLSAAFLFFFFLCCTCLPFFIPSLKDVEHVCPQCRSTLGRYNRI